MALTLKKKEASEAAPISVAVKKPRKPKAVKSKSGGKRKQFVLLIGDEGAILVYMEGAKVVRRLFAPSAQPSNTEAIVALMNSNPNVPISLLVDCLDQQFVRQSFPPVSSLSVNGLVKRRLDRDFQAEDIKGSLPLGRDKTGRKEWNFLLIAIAKTALLTAWIDLISELPNRLTGLYLVPVESYVYIQMLAKAFPDAVKSKWQLMVTHNKVSGFRQVVVNDGKLVFTRVTQAIDDAIPAVIAGNIEQEIINTIEYLRRMNFQDSSGIDIIVIASHDVNDALDLKRFSMANTMTLTPLDIADAMGLEQAALSADRFGDVVLAASFLRAKKHTLRFSTAYIDALAKFYKAKLAMKAATALIALVLIGMSGDNLLTVSENDSAISQSEQKRQEISSHLKELQGSISGLNQNVAFKSAAVSASDVFLKNAQPPLDFFNDLSPLLSANERVSNVEWSSAYYKSAGAAATGATATTPKDDAAIKVVVTFEFKGDYGDIEALSRAELAFLDTLTKKLPQYTITHELFPWQKGTDKGMEIVFDQKQVAAGLKDGDTRLDVTFVGPKKPTADGAAATPAPASQMGKP